MKKYISLMFISILLINLSCGTNIKMTAEKNITPPVQLNNPRLLYPRFAQQYAHTGSARVMFEINKSGKVAKAYILKSSGSDMLDNSAVEYCKSLEFKPAKVDGEPVSMKMTKQIKFQISNVDMEASNYVIAVNKLYQNLEYTVGKERIMIERKILRKHIDFIQEMRDALNFNVYAKEVLSPSTIEHWEKYWDSWPLSFLIFHDFMQRFPDYDSLKEVKSLMLGALKYDIKYIRNTRISGPASINHKDKILNRIRQFVELNYPGIKLDDTEINGTAPLSVARAE